jgi:hypothetical protein
LKISIIVLKENIPNMAEIVATKNWIDELLVQQYNCVNSHSSKSLQVLLDVVSLTKIAPKDFEPLSRLAQSDRRFRQLIEAGAEESAATTLVGSDACYMVSRGGDGSYLASVILPGMDAEVSSEGASYALALIGAFLGAIFDMCSGTAQQLGPYCDRRQTAH